jgi:hypothetical protein
VVLGPLRWKSVDEKQADAAGRHDHRVTRVVPEVADQIVALLVARVLDDVSRTGARIGQQIHGAVSFGHVVECDPAGEVRPVRVVDEAGVLVPAERHPLLRGLHDVLLVEQVDGVPEGCLGDLHPEFGGQEALDCWALAVCVDEVAAAAPVEVELVGAEAVHFPVALVDEALAVAAQRVEIVWREGALQDEEALRTELAGVLRCDVQC